MIVKEGAPVCYSKGRWRYRMMKRGGSTGKKWKIVNDGFFVNEMNGVKGVSDSLSQFEFSLPWETGQDR